ncbi:MAG: S1 RNA-binding domain-containing protein, partial [Firmicutes bacterium]|nr:S1 RNA-binding domain-containing protein [Bacillota bacterium]
KGHYGLGATFYSHFTSPIRRYPDLTIHRIIKDSIHGRVSMEGKTVKMKGHPFFRTAEDLKSFVKDSSKHSSEREVLATEAEREVDDMKKAEYMEQFIGEEFDGVISSVGTFGMFVELDSTIEGLIHVTMLDEDIKFHEKAFSYVGPAKRYKLGDRIRVKVVGASKENRTIDFTLAE